MEPLPVARSALDVAAALVSTVYDALGPAKPFDARLMIDCIERALVRKGDS